MTKMSSVLGLSGSMIIVGLALYAQTPAKGTPTRISASLSGGFELDPRDHGRPVALVAGALGVKPDVFREAFSRVTPAPAGEHPDPDQVRNNKDALLAALAPYGIANERLDQ